MPGEESGVSRWVRPLGLLLAWAVVVAACSPSSDSDGATPGTTPPSTTVAVETTTSTTTDTPSAVRVGEGTTAEVPAGPGIVRVPSEAVSGPGTLVVESVGAPPPDGFELVGGAFDVLLEGTRLSGVVEFSMPAPPPPPEFPEGVPTAWLATFDDASGSWVPIETVLVDGALVAEVGHFSWFSWITPDLDWLGDAFLGLVESVLGTGLMDVGHPECEGEAEIRDAGVDVSSDDGSSTMWCVGVEGGQVVLKVANNRRYSVGLTTPDGFEVLHRDADSGTVEFLTQHSEGTFGFDVTLSRGETAVFAVPDGASGLVVVEPSPATFLLEVLSLEVDFAASVLAPEGAAAKAIVGKCLGDNATDLFGDDVQGNVSAAFNFGFGCLADNWTAFFPSGWLVEILWGFVSSTLRLIVEGLVGSISGIVDSVSGMFDGSDIYRISIVMPQTEAGPMITFGRGIGQCRLGGPIDPCITEFSEYEADDVTYGYWFSHVLAMLESDRVSLIEVWPPDGGSSNLVHGPHFTMAAWVLPPEWFLRTLGEPEEIRRHPSTGEIGYLGYPGAELTFGNGELVDLWVVDADIADGDALTLDLSFFPYADRDPSNSSVLPVSFSMPLTVNRLGGITVGMTLDEATARTGQLFAVDSFDGYCHTADIAGIEGVGLMMFGYGAGSTPGDAMVTRISVWDPGFSTGSGIRVGDSESALLDRFGGTLIATEHEYVEDGTYYDLPSNKESPLPLLMRFTVEGGTVVQITAGYEDSVTLVEGCL